MAVVGVTRNIDARPLDYGAYTARKALYYVAKLETGARDEEQLHLALLGRLLFG